MNVSAVLEVRESSEFRFGYLTEYSGLEVCLVSGIASKISGGVSLFV